LENQLSRLVKSASAQAADSEEHINEPICDIGRIAKAWAIGRNFNYSFDRVERLGFASKFH
jgi:hypothetical protein